jgi:hypothetical protein
LFIWYLLASLKKNVTRQTWRALFHFGEYLFQSTRHFGEYLKKIVSHTGVTCHFICVLIGLKSWSFSNVWNLKMDVVLKVLRAVVIRWFSLNEVPLGLFKFISDYLPYFEKINIFFNITTKKVWINL